MASHLLEPYNAKYLIPLQILINPTISCKKISNGFLSIKFL